MTRAGFAFGFDPSWWWSGRRGPRHRRQWFEAGDMKYVILKLLRDKPMHGYEVMKALEEYTHGCYKPSPGTVYPTLQWLEDEGLVQASEVDGKKVYSITESGRRFLDENKGTVEDIFDRVAETIDRIVGEPMNDVNRAVGRVVAQAYRTAWKLGGDETRKRKIAEILDRAVADLAALTP
jgi:DNA-binding PadR family transcriptional regulator